MALPRIPNPTGSVTIPAVAEKVFADLFLTGVMINVPADPAEHWLVIRSRPFNYDTGELHPNIELERVHREGSIYALAQQYPAIAQAMGLVVEACKNLIALRKAEADRDELQHAVNRTQANITAYEQSVVTLQDQLENAEAAYSALPLDATAEQQAAAEAEVTSCTTTLQEVQTILASCQQELATQTGPLVAAQAIVNQCAAALGA